MKTIFYTVILMIGFLATGYSALLFSLPMSTYLKTAYDYTTNDGDLLIVGLFGWIALLHSYKKLLTLSVEQRQNKGSR